MYFAAGASPFLCAVPWVAPRVCLARLGLWLVVTTSGTTIREGDQGSGGFFFFRLGFGTRGVCRGEGRGVARFGFRCALRFGDPILADVGVGDNGERR